MSHRLSLLALAAALLAPAATAQPADSPAHVVKRPDSATFAAAWAAMGKTTPGPPSRAVVRCKVSAAGAVSGCSLVRDYPGGGMGQLLLATAPKFQVAPAIKNGQPVTSDILLEQSSLRFDKAGDWLRKPSQRDMIAVYPRAAQGRAKGGEATISCLASTQGALFDCVVTHEEPQGIGFGEAALALTPQFLMKPATLQGQPVVAPVRIPIKFEGIGGGPPPENAVTALPATMVWAQAPTTGDVAAAFPAKAKAAGRGGRATLYCSFRANGEVTDCRVATEEPEGQGFGAAARQLAKKFRANVTSESDAKILRHAGVQIPFTFDPATLAGQPVIGKPMWAAAPGADDVRTAFAGTPDHVGTVRVMLSCTVQPAGYMAGCSVVSESPAGRGFGPAALTLAPKFRVATWTNEGLPVVGGILNVPIRFETGDSAPVPAKP